jgi:predicted aspartyl protease
MKNLSITNDNDSLDFLFDTGANFSCVARSVAEKLKMNILPYAVEAAGATGAAVPVQIAVCPEFHLGNIKIQNAVFLVLDDKQLSFSLLFIKYKVLGIIGYPVIEALKEVQITKDGYFIVPQNETVDASSNMAMYGLTPLMSIEGNPYIFDTGANKSSLNKPYYLANKEEVERKYKPKTIKVVSAGGKTKQKGYRIDAKLNVSGRDIILDKVPLTKEEVASDKKGIWGRIGQDLIEQFDVMTLNFNQMFIKFD